MHNKNIDAKNVKKNLLIFNRVRQNEDEGGNPCWIKCCQHHNFYFARCVKIDKAAKLTDSLTI